MSEGIDVKFISPAMFTLECPTRKRRYDVTKGGGAYRCKMDRCIVCYFIKMFPKIRILNLRLLDVYTNVKVAMKKKKLWVQKYNKKYKMVKNK